MVERVEDGGNGGERAAEAEQRDDEAEMADGRIGEKAFEVLLKDGEEAPSSSCLSPASPTIQNQDSVPAITGQKRVRRKMPALTSVAE